MKSKKIFILIKCSIILFLASCSDKENKITQANSNLTNENNFINGKVDFLEKFTTKATINNVATNATVSLIYPETSSTNPNVTVATGLTDGNGSFVINYQGFSPQENDIFILEASKRLNGSGNDLISMRTYIKRLNNSWSSITTSTVNINTKTTALTLISAYSKSDSSPLTPSSLIGKLQLNSGNYNLADESTLTNTKLTEVGNMVVQSIQNDRDPSDSIFRVSGDVNGNYVLRDLPIPVKTPLPLNGQIL